MTVREVQKAEKEAKPALPSMDRAAAQKPVVQDPALDSKNKELFSYLKENFVGKMYSRGLRQSPERNEVIQKLYEAFLSGERDGSEATKFSKDEIDRAFEEAKALVALSKIIDEGRGAFPAGALELPSDFNLESLNTPEAKQSFWLDAKSLVFEQRTRGTYKVFWSDDQFSQQVQRPRDFRMARAGEDVSNNYSDYYNLFGEGNKAVSNGVPLFKQGDPRYRNVSYGNGTMASSACGPTSMAMVLASYGLPVDPLQMARFALKNGHRINGQGTSHAFFEDCARSFGKECITLGQDMNDIVDCLTQGKPVIVSVKNGAAEGGAKIFTKGGHFIVITGYDPVKKTFSINDPGGRDVSWCTVRELQNAIKNSWVVYDNNQPRK